MACVVSLCFLLSCVSLLTLGSNSVLIASYRALTRVLLSALSSVLCPVSHIALVHTLSILLHLFLDFNFIFLSVFLFVYYLFSIVVVVVIVVFELL